MSDVFIDPRSNAETAVALLRTTPAILARCGQVLEHVRGGASPWFTVHESALAPLAHRVVRLARTDSPPGWRHPRPGPGGAPALGFWRHLQAALPDWPGFLRPWLEPLTPGQRAHAWVDLATVGAWAVSPGHLPGPGRGEPGGPSWHYLETATGRRLVGSQGRAAAVFHAFAAGLFSDAPERPCQCDARGLRALVTDRLDQAFQVHAENRLPELPALAVQLRRLGEQMSEQPEVFGEEGRPAGLFDLLVGAYGLGVPPTADLDAHGLLSQLLASLSALAPDSPQIGQIPIGDCGRHPAARGPDATDGWVPLHAQLQWLTRSLLPPFEWAGVQTRGLDALTPLAHAAHGALLLAAGVLRLRDPPRQVSDASGQPWHLNDPIAVEWRALSVALVHRLWAQAGARLGAPTPDLEDLTTRLGQLLAADSPAKMARQLQGNVCYPRVRGLTERP
jgi:hypothetical protein